ncbi:MAG: GatB/YqeY domain-containing protein [Betaproteobacteria bacterium]|nr:GatB/YqeY domain-containing protein [Pseudomonadota bacterium]NBO12132.1 GatB/YqeY domain-containing protein [Betaproteobacteria bacterium]NBO44186.1 GatB/YqeY domain-containing protein [Betaproteobacteria bacterium]NBP10624.1 GatB/YqeY domain-containing protein [Betaproteobacteria bacterium]NBQ10009.1 GatB/YqeY domain-containing protein [Betaproteobacteria bacterium]
MRLKERIQEDMKSAMRSRDQERLLTIRMLLAAIKQKEVDERLLLDDAAIVSITDKLIKQRKDSIEAYQAASRQDLADKEQAEILILQAYMPRAADASEIEAVIEQALLDASETGPAAMGKVMAQVKAALAGRADLSAVSQQVKLRLSR